MKHIKPSLTPNEASESLMALKVYRDKHLKIGNREAAATLTRAIDKMEVEMRKYNRSLYGEE